MDFLAQILGNTKNHKHVCEILSPFPDQHEIYWKVLESPNLLKEMITEAWKFYQNICTLIYQQFSTQFIVRLTTQSQ